MELDILLNVELSNRKINGFISMDIGYYAYYTDENGTSPLTKERYREMAEKYETAKGSQKYEKKDSYGKRKLAIREIDNRLEPMAQKVRSECKSNQEVRRYLNKKYFGTDDISYSAKWDEPALYAMLENDYNAICFGTIDCPPNRLDPRLEFSADEWQEYEEETKDSDKKILNSKMSQIIENNSIPLGESDACVLSFDPYTYEVSIKSTLDEDDENRLKQVLDVTGSSKELFFFTYQNSSSLNEQAVSKMKAYHNVLDFTGYELGDLSLKNGNFYTENGENILDVLNKKLEDADEEQFKNDSMDDIKETLSDVSKKGFKNTPDLNLNLIYTQKEGFTISGVSYSV